MADETPDVLAQLAQLLPDRCKPAAFSGILAEPLRQLDRLEITFLTYGYPDPLRWKIEEEIINFDHEQKAARLLALADHYGVRLGAEHWALQLVLSMAEQFVPGFSSKPVRKPGRPQKTSLAHAIKGRAAAADIELVNEVKRLIQSGKKLLAACTILRRKPNTPWSGGTPQALAERYKRALRAIQREIAKFDLLHHRIRAVIDQHKSSSITDHEN